MTGLMRILAGIMLSAFGIPAASSCVAGPAEMTPGPVWSGVQPGSPTLEEGEFGLRTAVAPGRNNEGDTTVLFITARLPGEYGDRYGGRIQGATHIVAIDVRGQAYHGLAERAGAAPFLPQLHPSSPPGAPVLESVKNHFNVDLAGHLPLPAGRYSIIAWIDEMAALVGDVDIPAGESPRRGEPFAARRLPAAIIKAESSGDRPVLSLLHKKVALSLPATSVETAPLLMGICQPTREFGLASVEAHSNAGATFNERDVVPCPADGRVYLLAWHNGKISSVFALPPDGALERARAIRH